MIERDSLEYVLCLFDLTASQLSGVAATAFAAIANLLCSTPATAKTAMTVMLEYSGDLIDVFKSRCGLEAALAAGQLFQHSLGAVAAAILCAASPNAGGAS